MASLFSNPLGEDFVLQRYPIVEKEKLQAFDAGDHLLLEQFKLKQEVSDNKDSTILIMGDSFGALSIALKDYKATTYIDSFVSYQGIRSNSKENLNLINNLEELSNLKNDIDCVLIKLPKNMSFFEDMLIHVSRVLKPGGLLLCSGMIKHMPASAFDLMNKFETYKSRTHLRVTRSNQKPKGRQKQFHCRLRKVD